MFSNNPFSLFPDLQESAPGPEKELREKGEYVTLEAHTHPKGSKKCYGKAEPSDDDMVSALSTALNVVLGYKPEPVSSTQVTIGQQPNELVRYVCFFNKKGVVGEAINFEIYKYAVNKINNQ